MPAGIKLSEEDKDEICVCHAEFGESLNKIAQQFKITSGRVKNILLGYGIKKDEIAKASGAKVFTEDQKINIVYCYTHDGMSLLKIAAQFGTNNHRIKRILKEMGALPPSADHSKKIAVCPHCGL